MSAKSIKRNYIYSTAYSILTVITPLITAPYLSRVLEADGVGLFSFAASIASYFIVFTDMGTGTYAKREVSYFQDDIEKRSIVFWETIILRSINSLIALAVYLAGVYFYGGANKIIFFIYSLQIITTVCDVSWLLAGLEEFGKLVFRNLIIRILDIAFIFTFIKTKSDLTLHILGFLFFNFMGVLAIWKYVPYYVKKPDFKSLRPFRNIRTILSLFLPGIAVQIYMALDKTMLGFLTDGTFENGYYEQALKISRTILPVVISAAGVISPRIGYLFGRNDRETISYYMYKSYQFVFFVAVPLCLGLVSISDNFIPWFLGPGYEKVSGLLKISSFLLVIVGLSNVTGLQYLIPTKRQKFLTYSLTAGAAVNFLLNIILIRMYQSYGAITASVIAETAIASVQFWVIRRELSIKRIMMSGMNYYIAGGVMLSLLLFMSSRLTPSAFHTLVMILTGAAIYSSLLFILRDKLLLEYSARSLEFIKRKIFQHKEKN